MSSSQLEKLRNAKFEIQDDTLLVTCDKYMLERFKKMKIEIQQKYNVSIFPKKEIIKVKGNEVQKETFCEVLNYTFGLDKERLTLDEFDQILSKTSNEENIIKRRRSTPAITQINNLVPQPGSTSILSRKFSDLGEIPEPFDFDENSKCDSFLYSHNSTPVATLGSDHDDHQTKPKEFIPQKSPQPYSPVGSQISSSNSYASIKSQPSSPKREQNQTKNSYKNRNQNRFVYSNNKPLERRSTVPNCQEFSPKIKIDNKNTMKQNYNQKPSQYKNTKNNYNQKSNKNTYSYQKNRSQTISFYSTNDTKHQSDESSDSISTEPEANIDHYKYSPRSYSPPISSITPCIATSHSTNILLHRSKPNDDSSCNVEYKFNGNSLIFNITGSSTASDPKGRSAEQILHKVYETLGFNSHVSFNKIIFKC